MGAVGRFARADLAVTPGEQDAVELTVTNTGQVVDQFTFEPLGDAASFLSADPPTLSLFPGASGTTTITAAPPRVHNIPPGIVPFAIRVLSQEDPAGSVVEEGRIEVGHFTDSGAELLPRTARARGRRFASYQLAVDNRGNSRLNATVVPVDPDEKLDFDVPPGIVVEPGEAVFVPVKVRGRQGFWRGTPVTHQFQVVTSGGPDAIPVQGSMLQEAVIPKWVPRALLVLLLLIGLAVGAWFGFLKKKIQDTATDAAKQQTAAANKKADDANKKADAANKKADAAVAKANGQTPAPTPTRSGKPSPTSTYLDPLGNPTFYRLVAAAGQQSPSLTFPPKQDFSLTDILFQNPNGDAGTVSVLRGTQVLYQANLANYRDLDYHFVAPWEFGPGSQMTFKVDCKTPGAGGACTPAVSINGFSRAASSTPSSAAAP